MNTQPSGNQPVAKMEYYCPPGIPKSNQPLDREAIDLGAALQKKGADRQFVQVPNSELWVQVNVFEDGASLEVKKFNGVVYIYFFNYHKRAKGPFIAVKDFYKRYGYGKPENPKLQMWVHVIPTRPAIVEEYEKLLMDRIAVSFYWGIYADLIRTGRL